jgi:hypothetical protein
LICSDLICSDLICSHLGWRSINRQAAIDLADDKSDSHQHYRSGDAAQNETDKSQTRTIRHVDALMSSCPDKTGPGKRFIQAELICPLRNKAGWTQER